MLIPFICVIVPLICGRASWRELEADISTLDFILVYKIEHLDVNNLRHRMGEEFMVRNIYILSAVCLSLTLSALVPTHVPLENCPVIWPMDSQSPGNTVEQ